jgi:hypothetical protein
MLSIRLELEHALATAFGTPFENKQNAVEFQSLAD